MQTMTVDDVIRQLEEYKKEFGEYIGQLPVKFSGWPPDRYIESIALVEGDDDDNDDFSFIGGFTHVELIA